jgi:hypothetical protein
LAELNQLALSFAEVNSGGRAIPGLFQTKVQSG